MTGALWPATSTVDTAGGQPAGADQPGPAPRRFLALSDVADVLNVSPSQAYALVRCGDLPAIKVGGRGQWRVERSQLESYIERMYEQTRAFVATHPLLRDELVPEGQDPAADHDLPA